MGVLNSALPSGHSPLPAKLSGDSLPWHRNPVPPGPSAHFLPRFPLPFYVCPVRQISQFPEHAGASPAHALASHSHLLEFSLVLRPGSVATSFRRPLLFFPHRFSPPLPLTTRAVSYLAFVTCGKFVCLTLLGQRQCSRGTSHRGTSTLSET